MPRLIIILFVLLTAGAAPALAQPRYVGASLIGDIARFSRVEIDTSTLPVVLPSDPSTDGEALGVSVVLGTALDHDERWGVELEFVRPAAIENTFTERFPPRGAIPTTFPLPIPVFDIEIRTERRHTTIGAMAWIRQEIGDQFDLVYFGGVTFSRAELNQQSRILGDPGLLGPSRISIGPNTELIEHGVGPAVGVEGRWKLGEHLSVVPGLRLHGVSAGRPGWLFRPSVGARWRF